MRPEFKTSVAGEREGLPGPPGGRSLPAGLDGAEGVPVDVLTDEDLHSEGMDLLTPYAVVVTGTHPEYWTEKMLEGMEWYLRGGGRLMYMGGNGFYWVTSIDPERPHIIEVRRWGGTQAWRSEPGEFYHSSTGEMGGLWRNRNRAPQKMVGVGFTSEGFDHNVPYRRLPDSTGPEAAFIFEGIGLDESIGDFDCLIQDSGAAGYEVDRYDLSLGTPPHALRLATATGFTDAYQFVVEEVNTSDSKQGGTVNPHVRRGHGLLQVPAQRRGGILHWFHSLVRLPVLQRIRQQCLEDHGERSEEVLIEREALGPPTPVKALAGAAGAFVVSIAAKKAGTCIRLPRQPARFLMKDGPCATVSLNRTICAHEERSRVHRR